MGKAVDVSGLSCSDEGKLALRPKEAAERLSISERHLWSLTASGVIPHFKLGSATLYPTSVLQQWLDEQAAKGGKQ